MRAAGDCGCLVCLGEFVLLQLQDGLYRLVVTLVFFTAFICFTGLLTSSITVSIVVSIWTSFVGVCWPLPCCDVLGYAVDSLLHARLFVTVRIYCCPALSVLRWRCASFVTRVGGSAISSHTIFPTKNGLIDRNSPINQMVHHLWKSWKPPEVLNHKIDRRENLRKVLSSYWKRQQLLVTFLKL